MVVVLMVAAGAAWESTALGLLGRARRDRGAQALRRRRRPAGRRQCRPGRRRGARPRRARPRRRGGRPPAHARRSTGGGRAGRRGARRRPACGRPGSASGRSWPTTSSTRCPTRSPPARSRPTRSFAPARRTPTRRRRSPPVAGRVVAVWGPAGAPGPHHRRRRAGRRAGPAAGRRRSSSTPTRTAARSPSSSASSTRSPACSSAARLTAGRHARRAVRLGAAVRSAATCAWSPACRGPTAGSRSAPASSSTCSRSARDHGHVVVDTGFSLEQDPAPDFGSRPGRNQMTLGALDVADEVVVVGTADPVGLSRLARGLVELRDLTGGRAGAGGGQPDAAHPRLVREGHRRHGRGLRPADRAALPARRPAPPSTGRWWPARTLVEVRRLPARPRAWPRSWTRWSRRPPLAPAASRLRRRTAGRARRR